MNKAFTLAEVLITITIIGIIAALTVPSVVANHQQRVFKTGLKQAVAILNDAISANLALENESPYDNANLVGYLARHMTVVKSTTNTKALSKEGFGYTQSSWSNAVLYTSNGMRFEFRQGGTAQPSKNKIYESKDILGSYVVACASDHTGRFDETVTWTDPETESEGHYESCGGCGSYGLEYNPRHTTKPPCLIIVDVNGDKKPTPKYPNCGYKKGNSADDPEGTYYIDKTSGPPYKRVFYGCAKDNLYVFTKPNDKKINDLFTIMITDSEAIPYGTVAQRTMYGD